MSNFDITELLTDRRMDEGTDKWKSGHLCRKVRRSGRCFDITELLTDRRMDEGTDKWKSGHLCRKVRRSGRCFIQGSMVV